MKLNLIDNTLDVESFKDFNISELLKSKVSGQRRTTRNGRSIKPWVIMYSDNYVIKGPFTQQNVVETILMRGRYLKEWGSDVVLLPLGTIIKQEGTYIIFDNIFKGKTFGGHSFDDDITDIVIDDLLIIEDDTYYYRALPNLNPKRVNVFVNGVKRMETKEEHEKRVVFLSELGHFKSTGNINLINDDDIYPLFRDLTYLYILNTGNMNPSNTLINQDGNVYIIDVDNNLTRPSESDINGYNFGYFYNKLTTDTDILIDRFYKYMTEVYNDIIIIDVINIDVRYESDNNERVSLKRKTIILQRYEAVMRLLKSPSSYVPSNISVGYRSVRSTGSYRIPVLISALQKFIRRGMVNETQQTISEMYNIGLYDQVLMTRLIKRLSVISVEDIGVANIDLVISVLKLTNEALNNHKNARNYRMGSYNGQTVVREDYNVLSLRSLCNIGKLLAESPKTRFSSWIYTAYNILKTDDKDVEEEFVRLCLNLDPRCLHYLTRINGTKRKDMESYKFLNLSTSKGMKSFHLIDIVLHSFNISNHYNHIIAESASNLAVTSDDLRTFSVLSTLLILYDLELMYDVCLNIESKLDNEYELRMGLYQDTLDLNNTTLRHYVYDIHVKGGARYDVIHRLYSDTDWYTNNLFSNSTLFFKHVGALINNEDEHWLSYGYIYDDNYYSYKSIYQHTY